jgi:capsular polysaccharide transport system permease protein
VSDFSSRSPGEPGSSDADGVWTRIPADSGVGGQPSRALPLPMPRRRSGGAVEGVPSPAERLRAGEVAGAPSAGLAAPAGVVAGSALIAPPRLPISLPTRQRGRSRLGLISFVLMVVLPTIVAAFYFFGFAASQYSTEFHFTVRDNATISAPPATGDQLSSIASALGGAPAGADVLSNYTVIDYLQSRQALEDISKHLPVRKFFAIGGPDVLAKLGKDANMEQFTRYWRRMVYATYDPATGLAIVKVRTFAPTTSIALATALMGAAEGVVNQIQDRARTNSRHFAERELAIDRQLNNSQNAAATALRRNAGTVDPVTGDVAVQTAEITQLTNSLAQLQGQYAAAAGQIKDPNSPALTSLKAEIDSTQRQIAAAKALTGRSSKLNSTVTQFETLQQNRTMTTTALANTYANLETARANMDMQHLYVMDAVRPMEPTSSDYPNRPLAVFLSALVSLGVWLVAALLLSSIRAHMT